MWILSGKCAIKLLTHAHEYRLLEASCYSKCPVVFPKLLLVENIRPRKCFAVFDCLELAVLKIDYTAQLHVACSERYIFALIHVNYLSKTK